MVLVGVTKDSVIEICTRALKMFRLLGFEIMYFSLYEIIPSHTPPEVVNDHVYV